MTFWRVLALSAVASAGAVAQDGFYVHDGDRVVFYGDSITDQRLYTTYVETYAVTRFPNAHFTFIHSGWGGDRVSGGGGGPIDLRLDRDVFAYQPNVVTIMLGMNDASYRAFDESIFDTYAKGYEHIIEALKSRLPGVRITVIEPSPFDDVTRPPQFEGGYNGVLQRYAKFLRELAERDHLTDADLNDPVVADLRKAYAADPELAKKLIPDRVHPGPAGHLFMAEALLEAWHAPALVSEVVVDAKTHEVPIAKNARVTGMSGLSWTELDAALPMPVDWSDPQVKLAMSASDFIDALDREILRVRNASAGQWRLRIDGEAVGDFSAADLDAGVNLARYQTPMMKQALKVYSLTRKHADAHQTRWRNIQVPLADDALSGKDAVLADLERLDQELIQAQHKAAQPVAHHFELVPQS